MAIQENLQNIKQAESLILRNRLKQSFNILENLAIISKADYLKDKIKLNKESYNYLLHFFREGTEDPQREAIYNDLKKSLIHISDQIKRTLLFEEQPFYNYKDKINDISLDFDNDADLEKIFTNIWLSFGLSEADYNTLTAFFDSDASWIAKALAVSALTMSLISFFDEKKIILLIDLVNKEEHQVWERALVGLLLVLYLYDNRLHLYDDIINRLKLLPDINAYEEKIKNAILQIIRSSKETAILQERFEKEIMPEMMRLAPDLEDKLNLEELMADDMLDDDENPDWEEIFKGEEQFLEKMSEFSMLQIEGADIMHSTFSRMKFFDFFFSIHNWFLPFYEDNQYLISYLSESGIPSEDARNFVNILAGSHYMCNSDKYSFALQMKYLPYEQVKNTIEIFKLEANTIREVKQTESLSDILGDSRTVLVQYVQDLYRFFKLYPELNVITPVFDLPLDFQNTYFFKLIGNSNILKEIGEFYFAKKFYPEAIEIFSKLAEEQASGEIYEKLGFAYQKQKDYHKALESYMQAKLYETHPKKWLTQKIAFTSMKTGNYKQAIEYYKQLLNDDPENLKYLIHLGNCHLHLEEYDQALKYYFQVEYYSPGNPKVMRPIGWIAFRQGDLKKAKKFYNKVLETKPKPIDYITAGHIYFAGKELKQATELYKKAREYYKKLDDLEKDFFADKDILQKLGLSDLEINLMYEAII